MRAVKHLGPPQKAIVGTIDRRHGLVVHFGNQQFTFEQLWQQAGGGSKKRGARRVHVAGSCFVISRDVTEDGNQETQQLSVPANSKSGRPLAMRCDALPPEFSIESESVRNGLVHLDEFVAVRNTAIHPDWMDQDSLITCAVSARGKAKKITAGR